MIHPRSNDDGDAHVMVLRDSHLEDTVPKLVRGDTARLLNNVRDRGSLTQQVDTLRNEDASRPQQQMDITDEAPRREDVTAEFLQQLPRRASERGVLDEDASVAVNGGRILGDRRPHRRLQEILLRDRVHDEREGAVPHRIVERRRGRVRAVAGGDLVGQLLLQVDPAPRQGGRRTALVDGEHRAGDGGVGDYRVTVERRDAHDVVAVRDVAVERERLRAAFRQDDAAVAVVREEAVEMLGRAFGGRLEGRVRRVAEVGRGWRRRLGDGGRHDAREGCDVVQQTDELARVVYRVAGERPADVREEDGRALVDVRRQPDAERRLRRDDVHACRPHHVRRARGARRRRRELGSEEKDRGKSRGLAHLKMRGRRTGRATRRHETVSRAVAWAARFGDEKEVGMNEPFRERQRQTRDRMRRQRRAARIHPE